MHQQFGFVVLLHSRYIFPTKALAQDQLRALQFLCKSIPGVDESRHIGVFDGDTPHAARHEMMQSARIMICNPDILHVTVLPGHREFARFLSNLKFVVLDEAHAYVITISRFPLSVTIASLESPNIREME